MLFSDLEQTHIALVASDSERVAVFFYRVIVFFLPGCLFAFCNLKFYDWSEYVMSVLGSTKHSSCNCIDTWQ